MKERAAKECARLQCAGGGGRVGERMRRPLRRAHGGRTGGTDAKGGGGVGPAERDQRAKTFLYWTKLVSSRNLSFCCASVVARGE